jgi:acyl-homoserine-lactone acylase
MYQQLFLFFSLFLFTPSVSAQFDPTKIDIVRDKYGVPHIYAKTDPEVAYGLAYAHSEDDFATIQQGLMSGKAILGRQQGKKGASIDYIIHLLRIPEFVEEHYERDLSSDFKKLIEGYCAGLNAYATKHPEEVLLKKTFPMKPKELMQLVMLQLCVVSGADKALTSIFNGKVPLLENYKTGGSNAFAFNSRKTADGQVYLDINAHQPLEGLVAFYEAHLCSEEGLNVLGALFPGAPCILHGCNENLGWAHTVNDPDKLDIYQLEINPTNKLQYKFDDKWETLEERDVPLKVKIKGVLVPAHRKAYWSKYGPTMITPRGTFSIRMPALMDLRGMEQWYRYNKAKNFTEFKAALNMMAIPGYNIVYADRFDTIYYISNGRIPIRNPKYSWKNTLPGNTSATLWTHIHPVADLPQVLQPQSGFVFNTNHSPFHSTEGADNPKVTDVTMGYETHENNRSKRFAELVAKLDKVSFEDFKKIKFDRTYPSVYTFPMNIDALFSLKATDYPELAELINNLNQWDKSTDAESIGAGTFYTLFRIITESPNEFPRTGTISKEQCVALLTKGKAEMLKNFGRTNLKLGDIQKLVRGNKELPQGGIPDVLAPMRSVPYKNGMVKGVHGDGYVELVRFPKEGLPIIESVNAFGASSKKDSPHYTDQMEMSTHQKTKPMSLKKEDVYKNAERVYHPQ